MQLDEMIQEHSDETRQPSLMASEALEAPVRIREQLAQNELPVVLIAKRLKDYDPHTVMIVGRGSSDHAGVFSKYLIEIEMGIPTFSAAPSVATIYNRSINLENVLVIIISQSGRSPDILEQARQAKISGALCIALLNDAEAPLSEIVDYVIPLAAGEEKSVAATKSYLATLSAVLQLVAYWKQDEKMIDALNSIPGALEQAVGAPSQLQYKDLEQVRNLVVLGRGLGFAVGKEIALKLKEVCAIHAEAFSSAEFLHGPVALVEEQLNILEINIKDESYEFHNEQIKEITRRGADMVHLSQVGERLHPRIAPLTVLQRFYLDIEKIAVERGLDPDRPVGLKKVTETL